MCRVPSQRTSSSSNFFVVFSLSVVKKIRLLFFWIFDRKSETCSSLNRRRSSLLGRIFAFFCFELKKRFCLSFSTRSLVLAFSLVLEEKKRDRTRNFSSLISALPDHHITYYIKYGLHFIRFGFTPAQTTSSLEKFQKKLRLRQGTVSYLAYVVF